MSDVERREAIYKEYHEKVLRYVSGKLSNHHDAEDLTSMVFVKVYQKLDTFDESKASLSTWIYTITKNTLVDWFRTQKSHLQLEESLPADGDVEESLLQNETLEMLADALEVLSVRERDIIILHYYSGYTLKSIAEKMQISYTTAKVEHKAALNRLKAEMAVNI